MFNLLIVDDSEDSLRAKVELDKRNVEYVELPGNAEPVLPLFQNETGAYQGIAGVRNYLNFIFKEEQNDIK